MTTDQHIATEIPSALPTQELRRWRIRVYDGRKYRKGQEHLALADRFEDVDALNFQAAREAAELAANNGDISRERMWHFASDGGEELTEPTIGMGATFTLWTDCYACTVAGIKRNKAGVATTVTLRRDTATLLNGFNSEATDKLQFSPGGFFGHTSGEQRYSYTPNPEGELIEISRRVRRDGTVTWKKVGTGTNDQGGNARFGARHEHYDFNF